MNVISFCLDSFSFEYTFDVTEAIQFKRTLSENGGIAFQWSQVPVSACIGSMSLVLSVVYYSLTHIHSLWFARVDGCIKVKSLYEYI